MGLVRKILSYLGIPDDMEINARIDKARAEGREEAVAGYILEMTKLRQDLIAEKDLAEESKRLEKRAEEIRKLEEKVSAISDEIRIKEFKLVLDYAQNHENPLDIFKRSKVLLENAQKEKMGLSDVSREIFNNLRSIDEKLEGKLGYALLRWVTDTKSGKSPCTFQEYAVLLRYFRTQIAEKDPEIATKITNCLNNPEYYATLKSQAVDKIVQLNQMYKNYVLSLDAEAISLIKERGPHNNFDEMIKAQRDNLRGDARFLVGKEQIRSRLKKLNELAGYEKEHNINLHSYIN